MKPLWTCPECGHRFVSPKLWHSCGRYPLAMHFEARYPGVRRTFDCLVEAASECGPLTVYAQKTRIVFMVRVRFGGVITRKKWLIFSLWLQRKFEHPRLQRVEEFGPSSFGHHFKLEDAEQVDDELRRLICESYKVGQQLHLSH